MKRRTSLPVLSNRPSAAWRILALVRGRKSRPPLWTSMDATMAAPTQDYDLPRGGLSFSAEKSGGYPEAGQIPHPLKPNGSCRLCPSPGSAHDPPPGAMDARPSQPSWLPFRTRSPAFRTTWSTCCKPVRKKSLWTSFRGSCTFVGSHCAQDH